MYDYFGILWSISEHVETFKKVVRKEAYDIKKGEIKKGYFLFCFTPNYVRAWQPLNDIIGMIPFLGIESLKRKRKELEFHVNLLRTPERVESWISFKMSLDKIKHVFESSKKEISQMLGSLEEEELFILNEALNCYMQECNYSTVIMSACAIEFRLFSLMKSQNHQLELENMNLGELIDEYLSNKEKYHSIVPGKHEDLLKLFNTYKLSTLHPAKEKISSSMATAFINMTFSFLLDKQTISAR